jgi:DNA-binding NtrC family response regulator
MTAQDQLTLKTIILHGQSVDAGGLPEYRLLNELGHDVSVTPSAQRAVQWLQSDRADLVVVDSDRAGQTDFVSRLASLPADQQPRQIAIFSDAMDESLTHLAERVQRSRVHVLLKPLHMHGLLKVLRSIEGDRNSSSLH